MATGAAAFQYCEAESLAAAASFRPAGSEIGACCAMAGIVDDKGKAVTTGASSMADFVAVLVRDAVRLPVMTDGLDITDAIDDEGPDTEENPMVPMGPTRALLATFARFAMLGSSPTCPSAALASGAILLAGRETGKMLLKPCKLLPSPAVDPGRTLASDPRPGFAGMTLGRLLPKDGRLPESVAEAL